MTCSRSSTRAASASGVIPWVYRDPVLDDDRTSIERFGHEMNRRSVDSGTSLDGSRVGVQSGQIGQQGRVDVDQASGVPAHETACKDAHEAREHHELRVERVDDIGERGIELLARRVVTVMHGCNFISCGPCPLDTGRVWFVADDGPQIDG